ncbi:hypothetical protein RchiOBHm_Chr5g0067531 [Rosa chinensis]|uniref:Uncharacterized protein n=1 Tax=Rosa chinensis TaxID=74649 RepID=A0A2P6QJG6_ROSCH|nr:hypothetical protein RchiOBHm_Chr5g0067531 [Rosa chinensis]
MLVFKRKFLTLLGNKLLFFLLWSARGSSSRWLQCLSFSLFTHIMQKPLMIYGFVVVLGCTFVKYFGSSPLINEWRLIYNYMNMIC